MSETYPRKNLYETLFAEHIPSAQVCDCKGSKIFLIEQKKEYFLLSSCVYSKKLVTLCPKICINSKSNIL